MFSQCHGGILHSTENYPERSYMPLKFYYYKLFQDPKLSGTNVTHTNSHLRASTMLLLLIIGNWKLWMALNKIMYASILWISVNRFKSRRGDRHTDRMISSLRRGLSEGELCSTPLSNQVLMKLRGFGPLANYAERATAACWRSSAYFCGQRVNRKFIMWGKTNSSFYFVIYT
jgi:hypothetical protein